MDERLASSKLRACGGPDGQKWQRALVAESIIPSTFGFAALELGRELGWAFHHSDIRDGRPRIADSATAFSGNVAQYQRVGRSLGAPLLGANASGLHVFSSRAHPSLAVRADADARHRAAGDHEGELRRPPLQVLGRLSR